MGSVDAIVPEQLLRRSDVDCLVANGFGVTYKNYICSFIAMAVHLHGSAELKTNADKLFSEFLHD